MHKGFVLWFTGMSGAGKSTVSRLVEERLRALGARVEVLDGDEVRQHLSKGLGFSKEDRDENVRRIAGLAGELNRQNIIAIVAAISPYRIARLMARQQCARFAEVFVDCSMETLMRRDTKGLYRRAMAGELANFSGISDPYEAPEDPQIHVRSDAQSEEESLAHVLSGLEGLGYLPARPNGHSGW